MPRTPEGSRIGILGGSFDPPHLGHQILALASLSTLPIDALWVIPCANHAFNKSLTSFEHRYKMCELAFSHLQSTHVLDIEYRLPAPSYTLHTLETILKLRPDLSLTLVMGSDLMENFGSWEGSEQIKKISTLSVFDRATLLPGVQSSHIRELVKSRNFENLDLKIIDYIQREQLYSL
jgi:nicotinate-nucleotide adenylyltransferase